MDDRWITACHEAAHAVVNHALGVYVDRLRVADDVPRDGACDPEPVFEQFCGNNELAHPLTKPSDYVWSVTVAKRHAIAGMAGIAMEEILSEEIGHVPLAEESAADLQRVTGDFDYAFKYVAMIGEPFLGRPNSEEFTRRAKQDARTILGWTASRKAVSGLAELLIAEYDIRSRERIHAVIEKAGLRFGAAFPAFSAGVELL